ncbi:MAG: hypothetical protein QXO22_04240 [Thermosphaera sp.]
MSWFDRKPAPRKGEVPQQGEEGIVPPSMEQVTALQVLQEDIKRLLDEFFTDSARREVGKGGLADLEEKMIRGIISNREFVVTRLRVLPQATFSIINRKTLSNSLLMSMISVVSMLLARAQAVTSEIEMRMHKIVSGTCTRDEFVEHMNRLHDLLPTLLSIPYSVPVILKDFDGIINLNTPFNVTSDLVRKHTGYTATG